jgi:hypothetical protein
MRLSRLLLKNNFMDVAYVWVNTSCSILFVSIQWNNILLFWLVFCFSWWPWNCRLSPFRSEIIFKLLMAFVLVLEIILFPTTTIQFQLSGFVCSVCWATSRQYYVIGPEAYAIHVYCSKNNSEQLLAKWCHLWSASYRWCTLLIVLHIAKRQQFHATLMSSI